MPKWNRKSANFKISPNFPRKGGGNFPPPKKNWPPQICQNDKIQFFYNCHVGKQWSRSVSLKAAAKYEAIFELGDE